MTQESVQERTEWRHSDVDTEYIHVWLSSNLKTKAKKICQIWKSDLGKVFTEPS